MKFLKINLFILGIILLQFNLVHPMLKSTGAQKLRKTTLTKTAKTAAEPSMWHKLMYGTGTPSKPLFQDEVDQMRKKDASAPKSEEKSSWEWPDWRKYATGAAVAGGTMVGGKLYYDQRQQLKTTQQYIMSEQYKQQQQEYAQQLKDIITNQDEEKLGKFLQQHQGKIDPFVLNNALHQSLVTPAKVEKTGMLSRTRWDSKKTNIIKKLIDAGAYPQPAIHWAMSMQDHALISWLVPKNQQHMNSTLLQHAAFTGDTALAQLHISQADQSARNHALSTAAFNNNENMVDLLMPHAHNYGEAAMMANPYQEGKPNETGARIQGKLHEAWLAQQKWLQEGKSIDDFKPPVDHEMIK